MTSLPLDVSLKVKFRVRRGGWGTKISCLSKVQKGRRRVESFYRESKLTPSVKQGRMGLVHDCLLRTTGGVATWPSPPCLKLAGTDPGCHGWSSNNQDPSMFCKHPS